MTAEERVNWITVNLDTQPDWTLDDYREFYDRDVRYLLGENARLTRTATAGVEAEQRTANLQKRLRVSLNECEALRAENARLRERLRGIGNPTYGGGASGEPGEAD